MRHNDDFIGQLEDYLGAFDGMTPLPDRVRDAIRAELPSARQVRPRPGRERVFIVVSNTSAAARIGVAAATVVVAVALGGAFLNSSRPGGIVGGGPTPAPTATTAPTEAATATATPTPLPSVAAAPLSLAAAPYVACDSGDSGKSCIAPGRYQLDGGAGEWPGVVTIDVPAGWQEWQAQTGFDGVLLNGGPAESYAGTGWGVMFSTVGDVARDPCDGSNGLIPAAQVDTPGKLAAAMAAWPKFTATTPEPITVAGHDGVRFQMTLDTKGSCPGNPSGWVTVLGSGVDLYPMIGFADTRPGTFEIIDTGHGLLVIRTTEFPQTSPAEIAGRVNPDPARHAGDLPALHAILDSIRITPPGSS